MNIDYIKTFYNGLSSDNLSFIYQGDFSDHITDKIIHLSESNMDNVEELGKLKNKVSFMIVECFQNIVRHGNDAKAANNTKGAAGLFLTRNIGNTFFITSANLIDNAHIESLKGKLDKINSMDKDQIKAFYLEVLAGMEISGKGGAGLGLIEMARKSGHPLLFNFEKYNDTLSLFYLTVKMQGKGEGGDPPKAFMTEAELQKLMSEENIMMIYKGDFSHATIMPVLNMIEDNFAKQNESAKTKQKVFHILVEALQNIVRHGKQVNGQRSSVFMIGKKGDKYIVSTGNLIDTNETDSLKAKIEKVNSASREELSAMYKKQLKEGVKEDNGAGLGLIDIAREASEKMDFSFDTLNGNDTFFSLSIQV